MTLFPWRVDAHTSPTGSWGLSMSEKLNGSKCSCQHSSKHPWKQGKGEPYCVVAWLLCGSSAKGFWKLPSDRETSRSFKYPTAVYATIRKTAPTEKNVFLFCFCESRLWSSLLRDLEERQRIVLKEPRVEFLKVWLLGYNSHAVQFSLGQAT